MAPLTKKDAATAFYNWLDENWTVEGGEVAEFRLRIEGKPGGAVYELDANNRTAGDVGGEVPE